MRSILENVTRVRPKLVSIRRLETDVLGSFAETD